MHCPLCSSSAVLYDSVRGEQVCTRCGFVIFERLYELGPEWRAKPGEELERADLSAGADVAQHDLGLGTTFGVSRDLSPAERARLRRMRILQQRSRIVDWEDRSLREVLVDLDKLCEDLSLPKGFKAEVSMQYRRARAKKLTAGRSAHQILAALIFVTCRLRGIPRTDDEISAALAGRFDLEEHSILKNIHRLTKLLAHELGLKLPRISIESYIDRFAPQLDLSREAIVRAHEIPNILPKSFVQGKSPVFLAAVAIYLGSEMSGEKLTMKKISSLLSVGTSSLSNNIARARELIKAAR